ncbi:sialoadhesin-like isoform X1 [Labeo rohita]|uniref:Sialoadhesin-like isoform X1 n=1 Tax=Labeo rohita TaxID=84645 RepID=A0A498MNW5_LABRO|nr:sialoadhesin-like isoform X1 [Labeo rohita]
MKDGVKHLSSAAVSLTVTDLQVRMSPVPTDLADERVQLTCDSSCTLTSGGHYYWIKDGQHFTDAVSHKLVSISSDAGSFSCSRDKKHHSSSVCVSNSGCWDVTYTSTRVCALVNSTVDISCTYSHPSDHTVNKTFWHYGPSDGRSQDVKDLREEHQFAGRVEYVGNKLRIKDLKISTQINSSPSVVSEEEDVILSCSTNCTLNDKHTYIWYKNGRQVTDGFTKVNKLYLDSVSNEDLQQYSCAVGGRSALCHSYVNLHKVKIMNSRLSALILLLLIPGFVTLDQLSVTCSQESICAVKGSEVTLNCSYSNINIKTVFWFSKKQSTNWRKNNEPEDLTLDSDYSGRVKHQISSSSATLTISDVRERDSGEYQLMFIMNDGVKHLRSAAVSLTVTGRSALCLSYVNLHKVKIMNSRLSALILLLLIPGFVTLDQLSVTCSQESICAVKGSEVTLNCSYSNINIKTVFWFSKKQSTNWRKNNEPEDLTLDSDYSGRVKHQISSSSATLTISDVRERDSGEYQLMFIMNDGVKHLRSAAVSLTVTGTQIKSSTSVVRDEEEVILRCLTKCTLNNKHTYIWYKNGRQVTDGFTKVNKLYLDSVSNEDLQQYSCAVGDPTSPESSTALLITVIILSALLILTLIGVLWYRENFRLLLILVLHFPDTQVTSSPDALSGGEKVILSCLTRCTLNDKHTYIWYKNGRQIQMFQMSSSTSALCPSELLE